MLQRRGKYLILRLTERTGCAIMMERLSMTNEIERWSCYVSHYRYRRISILSLKI